MKSKMNSEYFVSVLLPVRNEEKFIERTLHSLYKQTYQNFEIIIADGQSNDSTKEIIRTFIKNYPNIKVNHLINHKQIFASGFNIAFNESIGEIILMLGGHTCLQNDYIEKCVLYLSQKPGIDCIGGVIDTIGETWCSKMISTAMCSKFGVGGVAFRTGIQSLQETDTVAFGVYRRKVFEKAGLLDESMVKNQDDEFNYRIRAKGFRIFIAPDIHAEYYSRSNIFRLFIQYFLYGFWKVKILHKWSNQMKFRHFVPALFVLSLIFLPIIGIFSHSFLILWKAEIIVYILLNFVSAILILRKTSQLTTFMIIPMIFLILHLSYGIGFIVGLIKYLRLGFTK